MNTPEQQQDAEARNDAYMAKIAAERREKNDRNRALAEGLARELGAGWEASASRHHADDPDHPCPYEHGFYLTHTGDQLELSCGGFDRYGHRGRLAFTAGTTVNAPDGCYIRPNGNRSATVSQEKPLRLIARDLERRLLPVCRELAALYAEHTDRLARYDAAVAANTASLTAILPELRRSSQASSGNPLVLYTPGSWCYGIHVGPDSIGFERLNLPVELAEDVLRLIADNLEAVPE